MLHKFSKYPVCLMLAYISSGDDVDMEITDHVKTHTSDYLDHPLPCSEGKIVITYKFQASFYSLLKIHSSLVETEKYP